MKIGSRLNKKKTERHYFYDYGRGKGQRIATGDFIYTKPKDDQQKNHNKETLKLIRVKQSQKTIEEQSIGTPYIPAHKFKTNFLEFYDEYVEKHTRAGNRHLKNSFTHLKRFTGNRTFLAPIEITTDFCKLFRQYLLDNFNGETPLNYYARFKWVLEAATEAKYFVNNPTAKVYSKANPNVRIKAIIEVAEYIALLNTPCTNQEVSLAFIFCCYTGLRFCDVKRLAWKDINGEILITHFTQKKTGERVAITLHPIARAIIDIQRKKARLKKDPNFVFSLPTANGANGVLDTWVLKAGIKKHITWSCARLSFSVLLMDALVDKVTISILMGLKTTKQIDQTYRRFCIENQLEVISKLPNPENSPYYLNLAI